MNNPIAEQFRVALNFLLQQEGRGAQVRLALAQNIDRGYLNAVIKGRKPAAEEIRLKIVGHFGMLHEQIQTFGSSVLKEPITDPGRGEDCVAGLKRREDSCNHNRKGVARKGYHGDHPDCIRTP